MRQLFIITTLALSLAAQAEVYKCPAPNGGTIYQEKPCTGGAALNINAGAPTFQGQNRPILRTPYVGLRPGEKQLLQDIRAKEQQERQAATAREREQMRIDQRNKELCANAKQNKRWAETKRGNSRDSSNYEAEVYRYSEAVKAYCH